MDSLMDTLGPGCDGGGLVDARLWHCGGGPSLVVEDKSLRTLDGPMVAIYMSWKPIAIGQDC
jgi:hypothetical protein